MKSQTLSQFQSVMQELNSFARKAGSKDKVKRKSRTGLKVTGGLGVTAAGGYGASAGIRAGKQMGVEKKAVEAGSKAAADARNAFQNSTRTPGKKAFQKKTAQKLGQEAAKAADAFIEKGGIGKRAVGIAKSDAKKVASKASKVGAKVLSKILRRGK